MMVSLDVPFSLLLSCMTLMDLFGSDTGRTARERSCGW